MPDVLRDQPLQVDIVDGRIVISIGVDALFAGPLECDAIDAGEIEITDHDAFAQAIVVKLEDEDEDGTTLIHRAFDRAAELAIDDGCDGVIEATEGGTDVL